MDARLNYYGNTAGRGQSPPPVAEDQPARGRFQLRRTVRSLPRPWTRRYTAR